MSKFTTTMACIDSLVATLRASAALNSAVSGLCSGKSLAYWIGYDEMKLPPLASAPYLVLMPNQYGRNDDQSGQIHGVQIALVIEAEGTTNINGVTRYTGIQYAETIARAIDAALASWISTNFNDGQNKTPFVPQIALPAVKTVWSYEFQDQI